MASEIRVKIIPELWSISGEFLKRKKAEVVTLKGLLENNDFEKMAFMGHQIKGNAGSYGMAGLSQLATILMAMAKEKDVQGLRSLLAEMQDYTDRVVLEQDEHDLAS